MNKKNLCAAAGKCGGCQLLNLSYEQQLSHKQAKVIGLLGKFCHVDEIIGMKEPYHYRAKVQAAFCTTRSGMIISGVYQSSTHNIVKVDSCLLEDETADAIICDIRSLLKTFKITTYNENSGAGFLRHVLVRRSIKTGEVLVCIVSASPVFPARNNFIKALRELHPEITTVVHNVNTRRTSLVLGDKQTVVFGSGYITDELCGRIFRVSAKSFYQINPIQTEVLYNKAMEFAALTGRETVLDAYCGVGTIGLIAAKTAKYVIGVENNRDAVNDAIANAKINEAANIRFFCDDASEFMRRSASDGEKADVLIMDPPRAGSTPEFIEAANILSPKRIVYVSCNPETLARDLYAFAKKGYKTVKIQPVDMFPHTSHIEAVALLIKSKA